MEFLKSNLKTGMRIETKEGGLYLVLKDCDTSLYGHQDYLFASFDGGFLIGTEYDNNLKYMRNRDNDSCYDIIKIYTTESGSCDSFTMLKDHCSLIWERQAPKKMTKEQIEKELGYSIELIS